MRSPWLMNPWLMSAPAHEEQGWRTLHSHWQIWVKDLLLQVWVDLWNSDLNIQNKASEAFYHYVDEVMTATYSKELNFTHNREESHQCNVASINKTRMHATDVSAQVNGQDCNQHDVDFNRSSSLAYLKCPNKMSEFHPSTRITMKNINNHRQMKISKIS